MLKNPSQGAGERGFVCSDVVQTGLHQIWTVSGKGTHASLDQSQVKSGTFKRFRQHTTYSNTREKVKDHHSA